MELIIRTLKSITKITFDLFLKVLKIRNKFY